MRSPGILKVLFVVAEDWYFCSHRLPLALELREKGYDVWLATRVSVHQKQLTDLGIKVIPLTKFRRGSVNPVFELFSFFELYVLIRSVRPDILHQVALKPVVYGSIIGVILRTKYIINAFGGMGFLFITRRSVFSRLARFVLILVFKTLFNKPHFRVIVQNRGDFEFFQNRAKIKLSNLRLIPSAGVELDKFTASDIDAEVPTAILASRMLWEKGVGEFVSAAMELKDEGFKARFILIGAPDPENPSSIAKSQLQNWHNTGIKAGGGHAVEWYGFSTDMPKIFSECWVVCLPSYREGVPKVLIEAMAAARPIITTTIPGCKELVSSKHKNGILIPPKDHKALKKALKYLLKDKDLCEDMGRKGRQIVMKNYSSTKVINETLKIYQEFGA